MGAAFVLTHAPRAHASHADHVMQSIFELCAQDALAPFIECVHTETAKRTPEELRQMQVTCGFYPDIETARRDPKSGAADKRTLRCMRTLAKTEFAERRSHEHAMDDEDNEEARHPEQLRIGDGVASFKPGGGINGDDHHESWNFGAGLTGEWFPKDGGFVALAGKLDYTESKFEVTGSGLDVVHASNVLTGNGDLLILFGNGGEFDATAHEYSASPVGVYLRGKLSKGVTGGPLVDSLFAGGVGVGTAISPARWRIDGIRTALDRERFAILAGIWGATLHVTGVNGEEENIETMGPLLIMRWRVASGFEIRASMHGLPFQNMFGLGATPEYGELTLVPSLTVGRFQISATITHTTTSHDDAHAPTSTTYSVDLGFTVPL